MGALNAEIPGLFQRGLALDIHYMKRCPHCAEEIQDSAVVCRFCNRELAETSSPPEPRRFNAGFIASAILFGLLLAAVIRVLMNNPASPNNAGGNEYDAAGGSDPGVVGDVVTAHDLVEAYWSNEVRADQVYKGRVLDISGEVSTIGRDVHNTPYITLDAGRFRRAQALFQKGKDEQLVRGLSKRQRVTVQCRCDGLFGNVMLRDCSIR